MLGARRIGQKQATIDPAALLLGMVEVEDAMSNQILHRGVPPGAGTLSAPGATRREPAGAGQPSEPGHRRGP